MILKALFILLVNNAVFGLATPVASDGLDLNMDTKAAQLDSRQTFLMPDRVKVRQHSCSEIFASRTNYIELFNGKDLIARRTGSCNVFQSGSGCNMEGDADVVIDRVFTVKHPNTLFPACLSGPHEIQVVGTFSPNTQKTKTYRGKGNDIGVDCGGSYGNICELDVKVV